MAGIAAAAFVAMLVFLLGVIVAEVIDYGRRIEKLESAVFWDRYRWQHPGE